MAGGLRYHDLRIKLGLQRLTVEGRSSLLDSTCLTILNSD
uniref:Uncharacterized protein n=1 Tax=Aegilops tauschii subsp. strangulata TaxID=200361 RepID=A0A453FJ80_AEGTS